MCLKAGYIKLYLYFFVTQVLRGSIIDNSVKMRTFILWAIDKKGLKYHPWNVPNNISLPLMLETSILKGAICGLICIYISKKRWNWESITYGICMGNCGHVNFIWTLWKKHMWTLDILHYCKQPLSCYNEKMMPLQAGVGISLPSNRMCTAESYVDIL